MATCVRLYIVINLGLSCAGGYDPPSQPVLLQKYVCRQYTTRCFMSTQCLVQIIFSIVRFDYWLTNCSAYHINSAQDCSDSRHTLSDNGRFRILTLSIKGTLLYARQFHLDTFNGRVSGQTRGSKELSIHDAERPDFSKQTITSPGSGH